MVFMQCGFGFYVVWIWFLCSVDLVFIQRIFVDDMRLESLGGSRNNSIAINFVEELEILILLITTRVPYLLNCCIRWCLRSVYPCQ